MSFLGQFLTEDVKKYVENVSYLSEMFPQTLLDVLTDLCQVLLHVLLVAGVDDLDDLLHLLANLLHLSLGVGVEEDFAQECVVLREHALGNLHVTLEGGAWCILMLHHGSKGERADEGDGERVSHSLVVLLERVFEDVEAQTRVQILEEATSHVVAFVDDDGVLVAQLAEVGKGGTEHGVRAHIVETTCLVVLLEACLHRRDVGEDTRLGEVWNHLVEHLQRVLEADGIDDQFGLKCVNLIQRRETLGVVHEAESLGVDVVHSHLVVERQQVGEERPHLTCT